MEPPKGKLAARDSCLYVSGKRWTAASVVRLPGGNWLVDMGKNRRRFLPMGLKDTSHMRGRKIELYQAEVL